VLNSSRESPINVCAEDNHYEDTGILMLLTELLRIDAFTLCCHFICASGISRIFRHSLHIVLRR